MNKGMNRRIYLGLVLRGECGDCGHAIHAHAPKQWPVKAWHCTQHWHRGHGLGFPLAASHGLCLARARGLPAV